jgi:UDP-N-acetylmuramyl tripeptide synthase
MGELAARLSDFVVLTSDNPRTEDPLAILNEIEVGAKGAGFEKLQISARSFEDRERGTANLKGETRRGYCVESDRREAIRIALRVARPGDIILIAGKGHEDYQILGTKKIHFDDREVAREELEKIKDEFRV